MKNPIANVLLTSRNHNTFGFFVFHFYLFTFVRRTTLPLYRRICAFKSEVKGVKVVIAHKGELVVRVICIVDSYPDLIITTFGNVPADLRSAGIEYKDLLIR